MYASTLKLGGSSNTDAETAGSESSELGALPPSGIASHERKKEFEVLAKEILELEDIKSCTIINPHGTVMAQLLGDLPEDSELIEKGGTIAAVIWGGLMKAEQLAGPLSFASMIYEKYKFVGIPFPELRIAVLLVVEVNMDSFHLKDIVSNYVRYRFKQS